MSELEPWELTLEEIDVLPDDALVVRMAKQERIAKQIKQLQEQLDESRTIISALLGAPPPRTWKKWPNVYKRAIEFLNK